MSSSKSKIDFQKHTYYTTFPPESSLLSCPYTGDRPEGHNAPLPSLSIHQTGLAPAPLASYTN